MKDEVKEWDGPRDLRNRTMEFALSIVQMSAKLPKTDECDQLLAIFTAISKRTKANAS
jgi:hypothetical protein